MNMEIINQFNEHIFLLFVKENPGFYFAGKSLNEMEIHKILFLFYQSNKKRLLYYVCIALVLITLLYCLALAFNHN